MNWLAHMYLARHSDAAMLGALLGDFAFGSSGLERFGAEEHREVLLHRQVDRYTDTHPVVTALRAAFPEGQRRYAGIALDVYFDHLLARDWPRWSDLPLDAFTARAYAILQRRHDELPARLQAIAPSIRTHDWLGSYAQRASVDRAITRIATRLSRNGDRLVACVAQLHALEDEAEAAFDRFFPALIGFVEAARGTLTRLPEHVPGPAPVPALRGVPARVGAPFGPPG